MLKIGEFSKITQVSIKTLRYYDRLGLLKPAHIDRFNGYRYYNLSQLVTLNRILALKDLDFSLDQIKGLLKVDLSGDVLQNMLQDKADELKGRIMDEHARLIRVQGRLQQLQKAPLLHPTPVVLKSSPNQGLASIRQRLSTLAHLGDGKKNSLPTSAGFLKEWMWCHVDLKSPSSTRRITGKRMWTLRSGGFFWMTKPRLRTIKSKTRYNSTPCRVSITLLQPSTLAEPSLRPMPLWLGGPK